MIDSSMLESIKIIGLPSFVTVVVLLSCIWLVRTLINKGFESIDKERAKTTELTTSIIAMIDSHSSERNRWFEIMSKIEDKIDRQGGYVREEHTKIISVLETIERRIAGDNAYHGR